MFHKSKALLASVAASVALTGAAFAGSHAKLSGDLVIFSDMSNPAPRAVMEGMVERFGAMHPDLNIELTVIDR
ncbi:MAG: carbohydrate ABC transporter substrate-binding protein, partial [Cognatishimia sp.]|nr:carbohydrate ABC transporter substrate-binding protein [Cognatishimia sp.]